MSAPTGRVPVAGVEVDLIDTDQLVIEICAALDDRRRFWLGHENLHSAYLNQRTDVMARWRQAVDTVYVDGMGLVLASKLGGGPLQRRQRSTSLDWLPAVLDHAAEIGAVVYHLGGDAAWIDAGADELRARHPGLALHVHHGYLDPPGTDEVLAELAEIRPTLLLVGMGMPLQEAWMVDNAAAIHVPVVITVGAFLGYFAGDTATPPRWMGRVGLEWLYRLAADPRRLARRYLVEPVSLAWTLRRRRRR